MPYELIMYIEHGKCKEIYDHPQTFNLLGKGIGTPLEFVCQYAHYDNPVCHPLKVFQIHISPPLMNF